MKKLTPKQRREIYLKAADFIPTSITGMCYAIKVSDNGNSDSYDHPERYPEWFLFGAYYNGKNIVPSWQFGHDLRITILLLCAEMCNP